MFKIISDACATNDGIKLYERFKASFGEITRAQMTQAEGRYTLTLFNTDGDEMVFHECFSAGYSGEGVRGTVRVLKDAGFDITEEFVKEYQSFDKHK